MSDFARRNPSELRRDLAKTAEGRDGGRRLETLAAQSATLHAYLQVITKFPRLALDEERELGRRIRDTRDREALNLLVEANLRSVVSYAKRYRRLGLPLLELIHEGNLGLIEAARHFDPERSAAFAAHGIWWVRQAIMHRLAQAQAAALEAGLEDSDGSASAGDELAVPADDPALGQSSWDADAWRRLRHREDAAAAREEQFDPALCDQALREIDDEPTREALIRDLAAALEELDTRERLVIRLRYGLHDDETWTVPQIAERLHMRGSRVREIEQRATDKLRRLQHVRAGLN